MAHKTAQELMDEIQLLEHTLCRMNGALKELCEIFHDLSGCTGIWSRTFSECEYEYDDEEECVWTKSKFLEKKHWQIEEYYEKQKDKIEARVQSLHKQRNAIAKKVSRARIGLLGSIESTFGKDN